MQPYVCGETLSRSLTAGQGIGVEEEGEMRLRWVLGVCLAGVYDRGNVPPHSYFDFISL